MPAYIRPIKPDHAADLPDLLDDFQTISSDEDDGPLICVGREPDTGVPVIFVCADSPVLILTGGPGARDIDLLGEAFPNPYQPPRLRTDKERLPV